MRGDKDCFLPWHIILHLFKSYYLEKSYLVNKVSLNLLAHKYSLHPLDVTIKNVQSLPISWGRKTATTGTIGLCKKKNWFQMCCHIMLKCPHCSHFLDKTVVIWGRYHSLSYILFSSPLFCGSKTIVLRAYCICAQGWLLMMSKTCSETCCTHWYVVPGI